MGKSKKKKVTNKVKNKKKEKNIKINNSDIQEKEINEPVKLKEETSVKIIVVSEESKFDGNIIGLVGFRIIGLLLTLITFGLAYPFALCIIENYKTKHTIINGKRLKFDGHGYDLLGKWIWWCILTVITLGVYSIFIPYQKNKWLIKHTHYETYTKNTEEDKNNKSNFTGSIFSYIGWYFLAYFITIFSFGLFLPISICIIYNYKIKHTIYDGDELNFSCKVLDLYINFLKWIGLSIITLGIYLLFFELLMIKWKTIHINKEKLSKETFEVSNILPIPLIITSIIFIVILCINGSKISDYIDNIQEQIDYMIQDEVYTGQDWGDKYALYLKHHIFDETDNVNVSLVNVDESSSPELFIRYRNSKNEMITKLLYIKDGNVNYSRNYQDIQIKILCTVDDEEYKWAIFKPNEENSEEGTFFLTEQIMKNNGNSKKIEYKKDDKEFSKKYVIRDINITYRLISKDDLHNDMNALVGDYEGDNYITYSFREETEKLIAATKEEIEKSKKLQVGDYYVKYGTYKLYTSNLRSTVELTEDDEVLELKNDGTCHFKRSSKFGGTDIDTDCTFAVSDANYTIDNKKVGNLVIVFEGGNATYQVTANNELKSSWYKLKLK